MCRQLGLLLKLAPYHGWPRRIALPGLGATAYARSLSCYASARPPGCPSPAISARPRSSWQIIQQSKRGNKNSCMSSSQHPPKPKMTLNDGHKNSRDLETYVLYVGTYALLATFTSFGNRQVESVQDRCLKFGVQLTQNPSSFIQRNYLNLIANFCCDDYNFVHF